VRDVAVRAVVPGPVLFARYAFPPNSHGFCGPGDSTAFFEYGVAGTDDRGLRDLSQQFAGAWPYLELIAEATGLDDPLDRRVVEAYWWAVRGWIRSVRAPWGIRWRSVFGP